VLFSIKSARLQVTVVMVLRCSCVGVISRSSKSKVEEVLVDFDILNCTFSPESSLRVAWIGDWSLQKRRFFFSFLNITGFASLQETF